MENVDPVENSVHIVKYGKDITIVGTAHVLKESRNEVEALIDSLNPDTVCVELDESRYQSLKDKSRWQSLDIIKVIRDGKGFLLFANMVLSSFQKRVGLNLESSPGDEMIAAFTIAEDRGKKVVLADRDINVTLRRAWRLSSFMGKAQVFELLIESLFSKEEISQEDMKELMQGQDLMNEMMESFAEKLPKVKQVLIDERDRFLVEKIIHAEGDKILAVVGKGHLKGIVRTIENDTPYDAEMEKVPGPGMLSKAFPWLLGVGIIALFVWGFLRGSQIGLSMLWAWIIASGTITAIFAAAVLAHPLTVLAAFVAAPLKLLVPTVSAGMIMAPLEALLRKPQVRDFESLNESILTFRGFLKNRVTKILVVFVAATIGAIIGHTVAIIWIAKILATH